MANRRLSYCTLPQVPPRTFKPEVDLTRARIIRENELKWTNGTVLNYWFFDQPAEWATTAKEKDVVRQAFDIWKSLGIGLEFKEVQSRDDAEVRIGFLRDDGAWSYIGRNILTIGRDQRTMNFGWDLTGDPREIDTAVHEIGHTLGCHHEHQNPKAGIVWNEEAVYASLANPPNRWDRQTTYYNIIQKIPADAVQGSDWDPNSIMEYPFEPGLIKEPAQYRKGLQPAGGLSDKDKSWVKEFYPALGPKDYTALEPFKSVSLNLTAGQQANFIIAPTATREYTIRTFGKSDTVIVLFEDDNGNLRYLSGDDDSGEETNASLTLKLLKDRKYVLRIRLFYSERSGESAVMVW